MPPLRTIIADDEALSRDLLTAILSDHGGVELVGCYASSEEAAAAIERDRIALAFLDIDMPPGGGFDVVARCGANPPMVVFATAHAEFAVDAFDASAIDYVLKPFEEERVHAAVDKAVRLQARLETGRSRSETLPVPSTLKVRDAGRINLIALADVVWAEAAGDYALIHTDRATFTARSTLKSLESRLPEPQFVRVHRSAIVRTASVETIVPQPKGEALLRLTTGAQVKVSRTHRHALVLLDQTSG